MKRGTEAQKWDTPAKGADFIAVSGENLSDDTGKYLSRIFMLLILNDYISSAI